MSSPLSIRMKETPVTGSPFRMAETIGEDYTSLESIRRTGGIVPDANWEANWVHFQKIVEVAKEKKSQVVVSVDPAKVVYENNGYNFAYGTLSDLRINSSATYSLKDAESLITKSIKHYVTPTREQLSTLLKEFNILLLTLHFQFLFPLLSNQIHDSQFLKQVLDHLFSQFYH